MPLFLWDLCRRCQHSRRSSETARGDDSSFYWKTSYSTWLTRFKKTASSLFQKQKDARGCDPDPAAGNYRRGSPASRHSRKTWKSKSCRKSLDKQRAPGKLCAAKERR